jgi:hypothetical protein
MSAMTISWKLDRLGMHGVQLGLGKFGAQARI